MFIVFNKQKIYSYLIALGIVAILFVIGFTMTNDAEEMIQTSANIEENNVIINQINEE